MGVILQVDGTGSDVFRLPQPPVSHFHGILTSWNPFWKKGGHECKNYQGSSITLLLEKKVQQGSVRGQELYKITNVQVSSGMGCFSSKWP